MRVCGDVKITNRRKVPVIDVTVAVKETMALPQLNTYTISSIHFYQITLTVILITVVYMIERIMYDIR